MVVCLLCEMSLWTFTSIVFFTYVYAQLELHLLKISSPARDQCYSNVSYTQGHFLSSLHRLLFLEQTDSGEVPIVAYASRGCMTEHKWPVTFLRQDGKTPCRKAGR
jgi:hypothetical protein